MEIIKDLETIEIEGEPFSIPGTQIKIWNVKVKYNGEHDIMKTMSEKVATVGFRGDVEQYQNQKGNWYIRLAPKEEQSYTGSSGETGDREHSIFRSVALQQAVAMYSIRELDNSSTRLQAIQEAADVFYNWLTGSQSEEGIPSGTKTIKEEEASARDSLTHDQAVAAAKQARDWKSVGKHVDEGGEPPISDADLPVEFR